MSDDSHLNKQMSLKNRSAIYISGEICLRVLDIRGQHVQIGIEAPREIAVHRTEIYLRTLAEKDAEKKVPITYRTRRKIRQ